MKRILPSGLSAFAVAVLLGVLGCDSGGIETGVPADTKTQGVPADQLPKLAPINPPGVKPMPDGKAAYPAPAGTPEASKEATPKASKEATPK